MFRFLMNARSAKEFPTLTQFLVKNPIFQQLALGFHNTRQNVVKKTEEYLDEELLDKKTKDALKKKKQAQGQKNWKPKKDEPIRNIENDPTKKFWCTLFILRNFII